MTPSAGHDFLGEVRSGPSLAEVLLVTATLAACGGTGPATPTPGDPGSSAPTATQVEPLKSAATETSRLVGAAVTSGLLRTDATYAAAFAHHFSSVTAEYEMKWNPIERQRGRRDYGPADEIVAFATARGMRVWGHALLWHSSVPPWFEGLSTAEARQAALDHVRATVGRYRGVVAVWDVVNEAVVETGLRDSVLLRQLGPGYVAEAFRAAREADPDALLVYNDYGGEGLGPKSDAVYALLRDLLRGGAPVGGVGLQMHLDASSRPSTSDIAANLRRLADLGLQVAITEMDVRVARLAGDASARLEEQRRVYHDVVAVCVAEPRCRSVTFWGFTDAHSWVDQAFGPDDPLLFDEQYRVKPAYHGVLDALRRR